MQLDNDLGTRQIVDVIKDFLEIGAILDSYEIDCSKCGVGTCLLEEVMAVHGLGNAIEARIAIEINTCLESRLPMDYDG